MLIKENRRLIFPHATCTWSRKNPCPLCVQPPRQACLTRKGCAGEVRSLCVSISRCPRLPPLSTPCHGRVVGTTRRALVPPSCSYCDQLDMALLRLTLLDEILRADDTVLVLLADVMQACGLR